MIHPGWMLLPMALVFALLGVIWMDQILINSLMDQINVMEGKE